MTQVCNTMFIDENAFPIRVTDPWNSLPETVVQAKSLNTFKNRLDQFWSNQEILYNYEAPLKTGTGILKLLIDEEDLIIEESQESCDQNHLKVLFHCISYFWHYSNRVGVQSFYSCKQLEKV